MIITDLTACQFSGERKLGPRVELFSRFRMPYLQQVIIGRTRIPFSVISYEMGKNVLRISWK